MNNSTEENYLKKSFAELLCEVLDGLVPVAAALAHDAYKHRALSICAHYGGEQYKDELFQEVSLKVYQRFPDLDRTGDVETQFFYWVSAVARNKHIDMLRASRKDEHRDDTPVEEHNIPDPSPDPLQELDNQEVERAIQEWLASLTVRQRRIYQIKIENPRFGSRKIAKKLKEEGFKCSHPIVVKEWRIIQASCLEMLDKLGRCK